MDRIKISYRKYRKPGEPKKKDCTFTNTDKKDLKIRYSVASMICMLNDEQFEKVKKTIKEFYK